MGRRARDKRLAEEARAGVGRTVPREVGAGRNDGAGGSGPWRSTKQSASEVQTGGNGEPYRPKPRRSRSGNVVAIA